MTFCDPQVSSEKQVLNAISAWVKADHGARMGKFTKLFARCVRFTELTYSDIAQIIDCDDLVAVDRAATELAAHALIQKTMDASYCDSLGMEVIERPRNPDKSQELDTCGEKYLRCIIKSMKAPIKSSQLQDALDTDKSCSMYETKSTLRARTKSDPQIVEGNGKHRIYSKRLRTS